MPDYRLYHLDGSGKIVSAEWLDAADDQDAERQARAIGTHSTLEVWDRKRLVVRIDSSGEPPAA